MKECSKPNCHFVVKHNYKGLDLCNGCYNNYIRRDRDTDSDLTDDD